MRILRPRPLDATAFAAFGDVVELANARQQVINAGTTTRFHDLASVDVAAEGGRTLLNVFRARPQAAPVRLRLMERHPLGSQAVLPLDPAPCLIVVDRFVVQREEAYLSAKFGAEYQAYKGKVRRWL